MGLPRRQVRQMSSGFDPPGITRVPDALCPRCCAASVGVIARTSEPLFFICEQCGHEWKFETHNAFVRLWSLKKGAVRVDLELRTEGEHDAEIQLLRNGERYSSHRFHVAAKALTHSQQLRYALEASGWQPPNEPERPR
jgi:hypothetical protein